MQKEEFNLGNLSSVQCIFINWLFYKNLPLPKWVNIYQYKPHMYKSISLPLISLHAYHQMNPAVWGPKKLFLGKSEGSQ